MLEINMLKLKKEIMTNINNIDNEIYYLYYKGKIEGIIENLYFGLSLIDLSSYIALEDFIKEKLKEKMREINKK